MPRVTREGFYKPTFKRKRDVGDRWDVEEADAQEKLPAPPLSLTWKRFPGKVPDYSKSFAPSASNTPVGTRTPYEGRLMKQWTNIFLPVLEKVGCFTNEEGRKKHGYFWHEVHFVDMMKFMATLVRMSVIRRNRMDSYFHPKTGDPIVLSLKLPLQRFQRIYRCLKLSSEKDSEVSGMSNVNNLAIYDSLWSIRPVWDLTMAQFRNARTPPEVSSVDEALAPFSVFIFSF